MLARAILCLGLALSTAGAATTRRSGPEGLINPLLEIEPSLEFSELRPFKHKIEQLITIGKSSADVTVASVYFRDLNNGPLIGINEKEKFSPASLLKVPVMFAVFKKAEDLPSFLEMSVRYEKRADSQPSISTATLHEGEYYTVEQLTHAMIAESDNNAAFLLRALVGNAQLEAVYADLGLMIPGVRSPEEEITVREYGTFFRMLYNASYLSRAHSKTALGYLTETTFVDGLRAGVPHEIMIAHKFGERSTLNSAILQLHDCGIVYFPKRPYLLCVMTRGEDMADLTRTIKNISALVFREVSTPLP